MAPIPKAFDHIATSFQPRHILPSIPSLHARTLPNSWSSTSIRTLTTKISSLIRRQTQILPIPATYAGLNAGPDSGTVVGITLGSVAAFLLVLWLLYTCFGQVGTGGQVVQEEVIRRRSRSPRRRSVSRSETIEIASPPRRERTPPRREPSRRETIVVEETRRRDDGDDIVEVIEEHSPPPRRVRSSRNSGGYRNVDPDQYAGGPEPFRKVSSRR
ncbi:hypothetical protein MMC30_006518 [Trapelia coarctata]|nr:hypothetical protein [Trapelia coarctata]